MCETVTLLNALQGLTIPSANLCTASAEQIVNEAKRRAFLSDASFAASLSLQQEIILLKALRGWGYLHAVQPPSLNVFREYVRQTRISLESNEEMRAIKFSLLAEIALEVLLNSGEVKGGAQ